MRSYKLARIAARAELLRWRRMARRQANRAVLAVVAMVFLIATLVSVHVAAALALAEYVQPIWAALIVAGVDLVIALIFALVALRNVPDRVEQEALRVRVTAQEQMMEAAALTTLIAPLLRLIGVRKVYGLTLAALTARYLGSAR